MHEPPFDPLRHPSRADRQNGTRPARIALFSVLLLLVVSRCGFAADKDDADAHRAATAAPLKLGILPHLSPTLLLERYGPLVRYLESRLRRPLAVNSAPSFDTYVRRVSEGRYDLYITAPHLAAYHARMQHDRPLFRYRGDLSAVIIVAADSPIRGLADLGGKTLLYPDPLAVVTLLARESFRQPGIAMPTFKDARSHNNAALAVAEGRETAAVLANLSYRASSAMLQDRTRVLHETRTVPNVMYLVRSDTPADEEHAIKDALAAFTPDGPGAAFFRSLGQAGFMPVSAADLAELESLIPLVTDAMK